MTEEENHYPSPREALFGNDHMANLYCAIKYFTWHLAYLVFVLVGVAATLILVPLSLIYRAVVYVFFRVAHGLNRFVDWVIENSPGEAARETERRVSLTLDRASTKPVTRRIYNYCPVKLNVEPKWFKSIAGYGDSIFQWAKPKKQVQVCDECARVYSYRKDGEEHGSFCGGIFHEVREDKITEVHPDAEL